MEKGRAMRMNRRLAVGTLLVGAFALSACASGGGQSSAEESDPNLTVWFMRGDVPDAAQEWLATEWAERNDGAELTIEIQDWDGIVTKLQTSLASESQTPDVVEFGNTQVRTFTSVGALSDISDLQEEIGGDALIPSLVEAGSIDETLYAAPFFAGSRVIFYRESMLEEAGIEVPETIDELGDAAVALKEANSDVANFEGIFTAAKDLGSNLGWLFTYGTPIAEQDGDQWVGTLSTPEGIEALEALQRIYTEGMSTAATATVDETRTPYVPYNEGRAAMFSSLPNAWDEISPELQEDTGAFALPGTDAGDIGHALAGGSNIGIAAASPNQEHSRELLAMMFEPEFQEYFATEGGWVPGNTEYSVPAEGNPAAEAQVAAVENSMMTPLAPGWGVIESNDVMRNLFTEVAQGGDVTALAEEYDAIITSLLNE
ncbi:extracellular solute-binding protein [Labedella phragmitis]|uniref:Extracellular solute-binding protein n=2 Tax=Labedella phragmitis TaxID=2498849 RepID=A0A444PRM0_9MICO|nr:extracellular solute-binding protein [Labedella phragmitis]